MRFEAVPVEQAEGAILGHNVADGDGRRVLRKGRVLRAEDLEVLRRVGRRRVYVAQLEEGDVDENAAAARLAQAVAPGEALRPTAARTGRVNLYAEALGLLRVDTAALADLHSREGLTLATLPNHAVVRPDTMAATLKIIPYALEGSVVEAAEQALAEGPPLLQLDVLPRRRVGLVLTGSPGAKDRVVRGFERALGERLEAWGSALGSVDYIAVDDDHGERALAQVLETQLSAGHDLLIVAGETAIQDRHDITPRAIERAGGEIAAFGVPVDPGNLLLLAYCDSVPIVGAPGCSRSPKRNIVDLVLPRLLAGDRLAAADLFAWGAGGLLEDVPERPLPRSRLG